MGKPQDKLKEELKQLCNDKLYYDAAKLLVKIDDAEGIEGALWDMVENWMWKLKDADKETYSYAHFLHGFCREFDAGPLMKWGRDLAVESYRHAGELGNTYANLRIGICYEKGVPDNEEAFRWMKLAAESGIAEAQCWLGQYYYGDQNTEVEDRDMAEAVKWFRLAAEQEDDIARCYFPLVYTMAHDENIVSKEEVVKWLKMVDVSDPTRKAHVEEWLGRLDNGRQ